MRSYLTKLALLCCVPLGILCLVLLSMSPAPVIAQGGSTNVDTVTETLSPIKVTQNVPVTFTISVVNTGDLTVTLGTSTTLSFSDGVSGAFTATLLTPTMIPTSTAPNYIVASLTFCPSPFPSDFISGTCYPTLDFVGMDSEGSPYTGTVTSPGNPLRVVNYVTPTLPVVAVTGMLVPTDVIRGESASFRLDLVNPNELDIMLGSGTTLAFTDANGVGYVVPVFDSPWLRTGVTTTVQFRLATVNTTTLTGTQVLTCSLAGTDIGGQSFTQPSVTLADAVHVWENMTGLVEVHGTLQPTLPVRGSRIAFWVDLTNTLSCSVVLDTRSRVVLNTLEQRVYVASLMQPVTLPAGSRKRIYFQLSGLWENALAEVPDGVYHLQFTLFGTRLCDSAPFAQRLDSVQFTEIDSSLGSGFHGIHMSPASVNVWVTQYGCVAQLGFGTSVECDFRGQLLWGVRAYTVNDPEEGLHALPEGTYRADPPLCFGFGPDLEYSPYLYLQPCEKGYATVYITSTEGLTRSVRYVLGLGAQKMGGLSGGISGVESVLGGISIWVIDRDGKVQIQNIEPYDTFVIRGQSIPVQIGVTNPESGEASSTLTLITDTTCLSLNQAGTDVSSSFTNTLLNPTEAWAPGGTCPLTFEITSSPDGPVGATQLDAQLATWGSYPYFVANAQDTIVMGCDRFRMIGERYNGPASIVLTGVVTASAQISPSHIYLVDQLPLRLEPHSLQPIFVGSDQRFITMSMGISNTSDLTFTLSPSSSLQIDFRPVGEAAPFLDTGTAFTNTAYNTFEVFAQGFVVTEPVTLGRVSFDPTSAVNGPVVARIVTATVGGQPSDNALASVQFTIPESDLGDFRTPSFNLPLQSGELYYFVVEGNASCLRSYVDAYSGGSAYINTGSWQQIEGDIAIRLYHAVLPYVGYAVLESPVTLAPSQSATATFANQSPLPDKEDGVYTPILLLQGQFADSLATREFHQHLGGEDNLVFVDTVPPTASVNSLSTYQLATSFTVQWQGTDARSGIAYYDVQYQDGITGTWTDLLTQTMTLSTTFNGADGHTYGFRVRAVDHIGNVGAWSPAVTTTVDTTSVTGSIHDSNSSPIPGVRVSCSVDISTTTDANGYYIITNLTTGTYTLTPTKSGWTFVPVSRTVSVPPSAMGQDFVAASPWSGALLYEQFDMDVFASGDWTRSDAAVVIDISNERLHIGAGGGHGDYAEKAISITLPIVVQTRIRLVSGGQNYRLPWFGLYYGPTSDDVVNITYLPGYGWAFKEWTSLDIKAPAAENVWMTIKAEIRPDGGKLLAKNDADINFTFITTRSWSIPNEIVKIRYSQPWDAECDVDYVVISSGTDQYLIFGQVRGEDYVPISDVKVSAGSGISATTDENGYYTINDLITGTYTFTPTKPGYAFSPITRTVSLPPDATGQDFTGTLYCISSVTFTTSSPDWLGEATAFTATVSTTPPDDPSVILTWDFGDDTILTGTGITSHTYASPGIHSVVLTATNHAGSAVATDTVVVYGPPAASFIAHPTLGYRPLTVAFTDITSTIPPGDPNLTYLWHFGDGGISASPNPTHTYTAMGSYTVTLVVSNAAGNDLLVRANYVTLNPIPVQAGFSAVPTTGIRPLPVSFFNTSSGDYEYSQWDFGDGVTSTLTSPIHTYTARGTYTVTLTVSGSGGMDSEVKAGYIAVYEPSSAAFSASPTSGMQPLAVTFTNTSTGDYASSQWDFGAGVTSTQANPSHTYTAVGVYTITLTVSGPGGTDTEVKAGYITVNPVPVQAGFSASPTNGVWPLVVSFTNTSSGDYTSSLWNFGDRVTSTLTSPTHEYTVTGVYTVTLTVVGPGGTDEEVRVNYIAVYEPSQDFYSITGLVRDNSSDPLPGAIISTSTGISTTTDASGYYAITNLITGTYAIMPSKNGYTFSPITRTVNVPPDATDQDFIGTPLPEPTYFISGLVQDASSTPISDVTITTSEGITTTTDASGCYTTTGLLTGTYAFTPTRDGWTFTPAARTVSVPPDATGQDFVGAPLPAPAYSIGGLILDGMGDPVPNVLISVRTGVSTTTDASGCYTITGLLTGTYTFTPSKGNYIFLPPARTVSLPPNAIEQEFTAVSAMYYADTFDTDTRANYTQEYNSNNDSTLSWDGTNQWIYITTSGWNGSIWRTNAVVPANAAYRIDFNVSEFHGASYLRFYPRASNFVGGVNRLPYDGVYMSLFDDHVSYGKIINGTQTGTEAPYDLQPNTWYIARVVQDETAYSFYIDFTLLGTLTFTDEVLSQPMYMGFGSEQPSGSPIIYYRFDNLYAWPPVYSVTGLVRDDGSNPISGVTISASTGVSTTTDASGVYTIAGLVSGTYTMTPSKSGWAFAPSTRTLSVPPDISGQDFTGTLFGDLDHDCDVDVGDIMQVASRWNTHTGDPGYNTACDLDHDGDIDVADIMQVAAVWGQTCGDGMAMATPGFDVDGPTLYLAPTRILIQPGDRIDLSVEIKDAKNLGGVQFDLVFDPAQFDFDSVTLGPALGSTGNTARLLEPVGNCQAGHITCGGFSFGEYEGPTAGQLFVVSLIARQVGTAPVTLTSVQLVDRAGQVYYPASVEPALVAVGQSRLYLPLVCREAK
ncbi:MAG: PKD domain-containing protein [Chloroflexi bacterium]|nr:PKD domain-containing protein [Chloroflexota bacterium]MBU1750132.1 PKD domain-containing protein [Chloroflexota bacterium]